MEHPGTVTQILLEASGGGREALDRLIPLLYEELGRLARAHLRRSGAGELDTQALLHEAYLRLVDRTQVSWIDRAHFFAYAGRAMRSVLVDQARRGGRLKRGGGAAVVTLRDPPAALSGEADELLALEEALCHLESRDPRLARVVECRFFAGMSEAETAGALGVSGRTVRRDWLRARGFLLAELAPDSGIPAS